MNKEYIYKILDNKIKELDIHKIFLYYDDIMKNFDNILKTFNYALKLNKSIDTLIFNVYNLEHHFHCNVYNICNLIIQNIKNTIFNKNNIKHLYFKGIKEENLVLLYDNLGLNYFCSYGANYVYSNIDITKFGKVIFTHTIHIDLNEADLNNFYNNFNRIEHKNNNLNAQDTQEIIKDLQDIHHQLINQIEQKEHKNNNLNAQDTQEIIKDLQDIHHQLNQIKQKEHKNINLNAQDTQEIIKDLQDIHHQLNQIEQKDMFVDNEDETYQQPNKTIRLQ